MLCSASLLCCGRPWGHYPALHVPVLHASAAPLTLWEHLLLEAQPDALLSPSALSRERLSSPVLLFLSRRHSCRCNLLAAVLWLGSRFRGGRRNLHTHMFVTCSILSSFCYPVLPSLPQHQASLVNLVIFLYCIRT